MQVFHVLKRFSNKQNHGHKSKKVTGREQTPTRSLDRPLICLKQLNVQANPPFLESRKIEFSGRANREARNSFCSARSKASVEHSNIQKLKQQIIDLERSDFVSYRPNRDRVKTVQNQSINEYNRQNSLLIEWKARLSKTNSYAQYRVPSPAPVPKKLYSNFKARIRNTHKTAGRHSTLRCLFSHNV